MFPPADRTSVLAPHYFATLSARLAAMQAAGVDVIRLDEGSPDLPPSPHIIQSLVESANRADTHSYQPHRGPSSLRLAWADMYRRLYHMELDPEREIVPLLGSKEGIFHLLQATINPDELTLVPDPGYITYTRGTLFAGGKVAYFPLLEERDYLPDLSAISPSLAERARMIWLNYPNNPTGGCANLDFFAQAVEFARRHRLLLCHDAAYTQVTYDGYQAPSLMQVPGAKEVAIEFNTLSKSHNMAGWRVGAAVGNADVLRTLFTLKTNADSSHFLPVLQAAVTAMNGDQSWLAERNDIYRQRRDVILEALHRLGLDARTPKGSLYVWSRIPLRFTSDQFVEQLLERGQVSLTPGSFFGQNGEGYVRISITAPIDRISDAMERLTRFCNSL
jgi:LL-diaminopimelate aminotransferase